MRWELRCEPVVTPRPASVTLAAQASDRHLALPATHAASAPRERAERFAAGPRPSPWPLVQKQTMVTLTPAAGAHRGNPRRPGSRDSSRRADHDLESSFVFRLR